MKLRHIWISGALVAALATWVVAQAPLPGPAIGGGGGATFAANTFTGAQLVSIPGIGAVSTDGLVCTNTTAAANGAQQFSCRIRLTGAGFKTTGSASQVLDWSFDTQPIQGTANALNNLVISSQTAGGGYLPVFTVRADGSALAAGDGITYFASSSNLRGLFTLSGVICQGANAPTTNATNGCDGGTLMLNGFKNRSSNMFAWSSGTDPNATLDTGLSRSAAGIVGVGTGAAGSTAGGIYAAGLNFGTTENGAANAIACSAGCGPTLTSGMVVTIKLAHTLQAGANTFAFNGGGALNIKSHNNVSNNIAAAYASGSLVQLGYDGTQWQDMSQ